MASGKGALKQDFMVRVSIPIKEAIYKKYERIKTLVAHQIMTSPLWTQAVLRMKTRQENAGFLYLTGLFKSFYGSVVIPV